MSNETFRAEVAHDDHHAAKHPFALGVLAGAAVGVGLGLLFAPRTGAQMRKSVGDQWTNVKGSCSTGYHRAKDVAGDWAGRGHRAYDTTRSKVVHGAHETWQYVREVSDAVTRKPHQEAPNTVKAELPGAPAREPARSVLAHGGASITRPAGVTEVPVKEVTAKQRA
jgi:gas vesicle protein